MEQEGLVGLIIHALHTDGAHHKQWYLEGILWGILGEEKYHTVRSLSVWDEGIAP